MARVTTKLRIAAEAATFSRILLLPTSFFRQYESGSLASRVSQVTSLMQQLTSMVFGSGLTALPSSMCWYCPSLTDVVIPANIREIGMDAFYQCPLKTVKFLSATPLDNDRRISEFENVTILVPKGSLADYKAAPWTVEIKTIKEYKK